MFYISILCMLTKSEITITDLADFLKNSSRKGVASDKSAKSVISKYIIHVLLLTPQKHVFMSSCLKNMASCQSRLTCQALRTLSCCS